MSVSDVNTTSVLSAALELRAVMQGKVVLRGDDDYARTRKIWNGAVEKQPALLAVCETSADVQAAVRVARGHGMPLSVRGGGHDWTGRALRADGLVIDLSGMRKIGLDPQTRVATVGGGATAKELATVADAQGLVAALGNCGMVGLGGFTLGGGYGSLNGLYGLALDNLVGAEVVLADGRRVTTGLNEEPELFWAIRGGGGNFGVVTSLRVQLHEVRHLLGGMIVYPWGEAERVLSGYAALLPNMPDELGAPLALGTGPDGQLAVMLVPLWNGDKVEGERAMERLQTLGKPQVVHIGPLTYTEMLAPFDAQMEQAERCHWELRTRWLPGLVSGAIDALISAVERKRTPYTAVYWHHFHGTGTRVAAEATAFGVRQEHLMLEIVAGWEPGGTNEAVHRQWAPDLWESLTPFAMRGGYANQLESNDREEAKYAYGVNGARLKALKRRFDPDGVFTSAIPLPD
jgi:hypothetical protein